MNQLWTIIFGALLAIGFSVAAWHDYDEGKRQRRRDELHEKSRKRF